MSETQQKLKSQKQSKGKKVLLKKSVRRTIGALLLVSALIVAAIPVQNTQAVAADGVSGIPSLDDIVNDTSVYFHPTVNTSVQPAASSDSRYGFPFVENAELSDIEDVTPAHNHHKYLEIDMSGMLNKSKPVPIYELKKYGSGVEYNCLTSFVGESGSGYSPANDEIKLGDRIIYNSEATVTADAPYFVDRDGKTYRYMETALNLYNDIVTTGYQVLQLDRDEIAYRFDADGDHIDDLNQKVSEFERDKWAYDIVSNTRQTFYTFRTSESRDNCQEVYYIADGAFAGKSNFRTINIPSGSKFIGDSVFEGCKSLENLMIKSDIEQIGDKCFAGCSSLKSVEFKHPNNLKIIGDGAFAGSGLESIVLPSSVEEIGSGAFYSCSALQDAYLSGNELSAGIFSQFTDAFTPILGDYLFANCTSMVNSKLPPGCVTLGKGNGTNSGVGLYAGCASLQHVEIPSAFGKNSSGQRTLSAGFFYDCPELLWVRFFTNNADASDHEFVTKNNKSYHPGYEPNVKNSFSIWGPKPAQEPSAYDYAIRNSNTYMYMEDDGTMVYLLVQGGWRFIFDNTGRITGCEPTKDAEGVIDVPDVVGDLIMTEIGDNAFANLKDNTGNYPTEINIPPTVTKIGNAAFSRCGKIDTVNINTMGVVMGREAFANNPFLTNVNFNQVEGSGATTLGDSCFQNCPELKEIDLIDDNYNGKSYNYINIGSIGTDCFYTGGKELTIKGKMERGYAPYEFALDGKNTVSDTYGSHIVYKSGNPQNISCQYKDAFTQGGINYPAGVYLLEYPDQNTIVDTTDNARVCDLATHDPFTYNMAGIVDATANVVIPDGIEYVDIATSSGLVYDAFHNVPGLMTVSLYGPTKLPDGAFAVNTPDATQSDLQAVYFYNDVTDIGDVPFLIVPNDDTTVDNNLCRVSTVGFFGEGDYTSASPENPYYWYQDGIIYSYDGTNTSIVECLPSRGAIVGDAPVGSQYVTGEETAAVNSIEDHAFYNCDNIREVDLSSADGLRAIPEFCFAECDNLQEVSLPKNVNEIEDDAFKNSFDYIAVRIPDVEVDISDTAFNSPKESPIAPTIFSYEDSAAERYVNRMNKKGANFAFKTLDNVYTVKFVNHDGSVLDEQTVVAGEDAIPPADPVKPGYDFTGWNPDYNDIYANTTCVAQFKQQTSSSSSSSSSSGSSSKGSSSGTSKSSSSSSSSSSLSGSSSSIARPIIISGQNAAPIAAANPSAARPASSGASVSTPSKPAGGKTSVVSTADGITDVGKMSATVNGSSDNYVVKITQTQEANDCAYAALTSAFGDIEPLRYLPIDISLYDSTGTNKISPIPDGVSISITMPIPDDLAIYGGNAKVASTIDGKLEKIQPRFTVINSVPCMTYTVTHLSPYVVYVDTANLTATGIADATPKTADPIHPKWFLCIGLAAVAVLMFLKKDPEEYLKTA